MDDDTDVVIFQSKIQTLVKASYPNVVKLINYNAPGLVEHLRAKGAVKSRTGKFRFKVESRTWSGYKAEIIKYLEEIDGDNRLNTARETLAKKIFDKHYEAFPKWPALKKTQSDSIDLTISDVDDDGQYKIAWLSSGTITVQDEHPEEDEYLTSLGGSLSMKILYIHKTITSNFEKEAAKDYEAAKKKIDEYTQDKIENK